MEARSSGAAIRDILNILRRRAPWLSILINPVRVQGSGAAQEIAVAIRELATPNQNFAPVDLIVVARGDRRMGRRRLRQHADLIPEALRPKAVVAVSDMSRRGRPPKNRNANPS